MNKKIIFFILINLLMVEGIIMLVSGGISWIYQDGDFLSFLYSSLVIFGIALVGYPFLRNTPKNLGKKEGYIVVTLVWILFSFFGSFPFYLSGAIPSFTDAFFETASGFTTTGASVLNDIEALSHGLLFWRSITQWLGGMGIIVMAVAILPLLGIGGMQLFTAEVPGPTPDKIHPRVKETAKRLWGIYIMLTAIETVLLMIGGMSFFDAINHSFTTMATGGYSTKQASVAYFESPFIEYVISVFMFLAGMNFTLAFFAIKLKFEKLIHNEEFKWYTSIVLITTLVLTALIWFGQEISLEKAFRDSLFQVISIVTTTGYATYDYLQWSPIVIVIIFMLMFIGGSAGSTGGGPKVMRILLLLKNSHYEFKRMIHPKAVIPIRIDKRAVSPKIVAHVQAFIVVYFLIFVFGTFVMSAMNLNLETAMGAVIACLGNIGPGLGEVGPASNFAEIPDFGKWFLSFAMIVGRLELFTVLVLFTPFFWKK